MVLSAMLSLPLFSLWAICHCWLIAVSGPAVSTSWLHSLYTVMIFIFLFCLLLIVAHGHLPIPRGSPPCVVTLGCNIGCKMVWVPPCLYGDDYGMVDSELYVDDPFRCLFTMSLYFIRALWFFQFVFISGRHSMSISCLTLLSMISCNVSPSSPRSSRFGFCNNILVSPFSFCWSLSPNGLLSSASMVVVNVVCVMYVFWVIVACCLFVVDPLNPKVWSVDYVLSISVLVIVTMYFLLIIFILCDNLFFFLSLR